MVNIDFVKSLWMARNMSYDCAMAEGIKTRNNVPHFIQMLNKSRALEYSMDVDHCSCGEDLGVQAVQGSDVRSSSVSGAVLLPLHGGKPGAQLGCSCLCQVVLGLIFGAAPIQSVDFGWAVSYGED